MEPITPTLFVCKRHCATDLNKKVLTRYKNAIKFQKKIKLFIILKQITRDLIKTVFMSFLYFPYTEMIISI